MGLQDRPAWLFLNHLHTHTPVCFTSLYRAPLQSGTEHSHPLKGGV